MQPGALVVRRHSRQPMGRLKRELFEDLHIGFDLRYGTTVRYLRPEPPLSIITGEYPLLHPASRSVGH